jgi:hypothetical protein
MLDIRDPAQVIPAATYVDDTTIRRHRAMGMALIVERHGQIVSVDPHDVPLSTEGQSAVVPERAESEKIR